VAQPRLFNLDQTQFAICEIHQDYLIENVIFGLFQSKIGLCWKNIFSENGNIIEIRMVRIRRPPFNSVKCTYSLGQRVGI
jgi:hypothetical protein